MIGSNTARPPVPSSLPEIDPQRMLGSGEVPSLDGLRAVSVLIVMVSHSGLGWIVPGGFGVTMFFFISGFIITALLIREQSKHGAIGVKNFYFRRGLRLYPALAAFVALTALIGALTTVAPDAIGIAGGLLYFMNYLVIFSPSHVLPQGNHLWSLAVEAHFYLLYPWLFIWLAPNLKRLAVALALVCGAALLVRLGAASLMTSKALLYEYAYQASEARLDSIAYGALCASLLLSPAGHRFARALTHPAVVIGGLTLLALTFVIRNPLFRDTFRYSVQGLALMPVIVAAVMGGRYALVHRLLNARAAVIVGWLSYSRYLWHPAVFEFGRHVTGANVPGLMLGWLLAFAVAGMSYAFIEKPMLRIRTRFGSERRNPDMSADVATPGKPHSSRPTPSPLEPLAPAANDNKELPVHASITNTGRIPALAQVDGWPIHLANATDSLAALVAAARRGDGFMFAPLNLDLLVKLRHDGTFIEAMKKATYVIADGWPVAFLGRRNDPRIERTTGADLVIPLIEACARDGLPIYLFGTSDAVLASVARELKQRCPGLVIAGFESPPLGFDPESPVADAAIDRIQASGARICFLALGAPKQEILGARALERGVATGFVCVGAGLDFIAGAQVRAPSFMRNNGMEWLWRLATNPRRLAARYAQCALLLAQITLIDPSRRWLETLRT